MAPITRSKARQHNIPLLSLSAGVAQPVKKFQCIICNSKFASKAWVSRHFKIHCTRPKRLPPFAHPSCWTAEPFKLPADKEAIEAIMGDENELDALPSKEQRAIEKRIRMAEEQVSTKKALVKKSEQSRLRLWRWWFECNEEALRARMEFGPEGLFPLQGEKKLEQRGFAEGITDEDNTLLELASAPSTTTQAAHMSVATKPNSRPAGLSELGTRPVDTVQESDSYFDRDFGRSIDGKVIADYELASTRPLTTVPLLFCMSDSIIKYVDRKGETLETALSLGNAAKAYFAQLGSDATLLRRLEARFDDLIRYRVVEEIEEDEQRVAHLLNERQFCKDRVAIWDLLVRATEEYFEIFGGELHVSFDTWLGKAVTDVVEAVRDYAEGSKDRETVAYITEYLEGDI